jgi:pimeloyl-ACP methyl ester carboxylesterase
MSKLGYPTLAIDRLGAGLSDHPDPITTVQANLQTNIHHVIVQMARAGKIPNTKTAFKKIIFVGGSYGSILGNQQAIQYPADLDALLLTAYSNDDQVRIDVEGRGRFSSVLTLTVFFCSFSCQSLAYKLSLLLRPSLTVHIGLLYLLDVSCLLLPQSQGIQKDKD